MNHQQFDKIFKEKALEFSATPSSEAWDKVSAQMGTTSTSKKYGYYKVAAVVSLFAIAGLLFLLIGSGETTYQVATADYPKNRVSNSIAVEGIDFSVSERIEMKKVVIAHTNRPGESFEKITLESELKEEWIDPIQRRPLLVATLAQPEIKLFSTTKSTKQKPSVKIIYIAGATSEDDLTSKGKVAKLLAYAQQTSPADWMAELRGAKDELLKNKVTLN